MNSEKIIMSCWWDTLTTELLELNGEEGGIHWYNLSGTFCMCFCVLQHCMMVVVKVTSYKEISTINYYNQWSIKWVNLIISDDQLWNLSRKHSSKQWSLQSRLVREMVVHVSYCTCILLQVFDHEDLDDYQGDGQGQSSGITPEEYRGEPIVSQTLMTLLSHYALSSLFGYHHHHHHDHHQLQLQLHAVWPTLSDSCNRFGNFPVLPPCFVSLFFFVLVKVWEILDIGQCVLCQSLFKQKHSAIVSLTKLSTNWCFLVEQSWWDRSIHLTPSGANQNGLKIHFISSCHIHVVSHFTHVACIYANVWEQKKLFT